MPISNIVKNGGFETGGFPPWKVTGNTNGGGGNNASARNNGAFGVDQDSAHTGNFGAFAGPVGAKGFLRQNLTTIQGSSYDLSFFLNENQSNLTSAASAGNPVDFEVFWNGSLIFDTSTVSSSYTKFTFDDLLATGSRTQLKFGFRDDFGQFHLDDVKVGLSQVPESFSTLWLALPSILLLGFARLRVNPIHPATS